jgi:hypothetical protein
MPVENSTESHNICYISFRTSNFLCFLRITFQSYLLSNDTLRPMFNDLQSIMNSLFYKVYYTSYIYIKVLSYSQNRHDTLKQKTAGSFVVYCITYFLAAAKDGQFVAMVTWNYAMALTTKFV